MQIFIKERSIERKAKLATYLTYGGPVILLVILIFSFSYPESSSVLGIVALIAFLLAQYGIVLKNRWGRRPRIDEVIDQSLKGLDSRYTIFHYELGSNHVLISPSGIFTLVPAIHDGEISYADGKWWQIKTGRGREKKRAQNKLNTDAEREVHALLSFLQRKLPDQITPDVKPILVFLHPDAILKTENAPILATHAKKLKPLIRKLGKGPTLDAQQIDILADSVGF